MSAAANKFLSTANNEFAASLYQAMLPPLQPGNLIFSPFSLHASLAMVCQGARGETRTELLEGLQFDEKTSDEVIAKSYNSVITGFEKRGSTKTFTLLTANRIYSRTGYALNPAFLKTLQTHFKANCEQLDFSTADKRKRAAETINKWVAATTNNKIKDLISPNAFTSDSSLVLVNAIYFKGFWKYQFNSKKTSKAPFNVTLKKKVDVAMMHIQQKFPYGKLPALKAEAVALPYRGGRLSMVIILPQDVDGLPKIQDNIEKVLQNGKSLVRDSLKTTNMKIKLSLPKFKIESTIDNLEGVLDEMDIESMFNEDLADFSGISKDGSDDLFVSSLIQKAFVEVNEEGAEAAAASAVMMTSKCASPKITYIPFVVDRPFYFQIVDHANGELVLFSGHVNNPSV